jgi:hypothetical protein
MTVSLGCQFNCQADAPLSCLSIHLLGHVHIHGLGQTPHLFNDQRPLG